VSAPERAYDEAVAFTAAGGWRVVAVPRPDSTTLALRWLVAAGGCHDGAHPGLSHLTARLVYDARAPRRRNLRAALDAIGAEGASQTTREYAAFRAVAPASERRALLTLLPELARPPALTRPAVARERAALRAALATPPPPADALWDLLLAALWGDHPLARPPRGTAASVAALQPAHVAAHYAARYGPSHTVLAVAGACPLDALRAAADRIPPWPPPPLSPREDRRWQHAASQSGGRVPLPLGEGRGEGVSTPPAFQGPTSVYRWRPGTVAHVAVAAPVPGMTHPHRSALRLLADLLGRGGSARLYRDLRLRRRLVYSCGAVYMPYAPAGVFAAHAICAPAQARTVAARLAQGLLDLAAMPPTAAEVAAAQTRYAGSLHRAFETNASLTAILGVETLLAEWEPFAQSAARVAAVTPADIAAVARAYLTPARLVHATLGPAPA
jgi:predicted Zn-dependent peptidase